MPNPKVNMNAYTPTRRTVVVLSSNKIGATAIVPKDVDEWFIRETINLEFDDTFGDVMSSESRDSIPYGSFDAAKAAHETKTVKWEPADGEFDWED